jgi:hypothetical protein
MNSLVLEQLRPRPVYMTHRQLSVADLPVGDPLGGPAYGEKRGPAIAIFGAYASISTGIAIGASTLMGGLMIAGGVMSGLGAITGNKTLSTLGMVAGLAGGVGQFFNTGGFEAYGNAFSAGEGLSGGLENMGNQFMGNANFGVDPSGMAPVTDALINPVGQQSAAQQFLSQGSGGGSDFVDWATKGGGAIEGATAAAAAPGASAGWSNAAKQAMGVNTAPGAMSSAAGAAKDTGLLGIWKGSGDLTKMAMVNAGAGALSGMGEASAAEDRLEAERPLLAAREKESAAQTALMEKKAAGVPMASVGAFGANKSAAFGKNASGESRTYAEYIADRTGAMQRLFGTQQPVAA